MKLYKKDSKRFDKSNKKIKIVSDMNFSSKENDLYIYPILYLHNKNKNIPGISDFIDFCEIPIFINYNIFQLSVINLLYNKFFDFSFIYEESEKKYIKYFNEIRFTGNIDKRLFIKGSNQKGLINSFDFIISNKKNFKKLYFLFVPSSLTSLINIKESIGNINIKKNIYKLTIDNDESLFLVSKDYLFKNVLRSVSSLSDSVNDIIEIFKNIDSEQIKINSIYYGFSNLKNYFMQHYKLLEKNSKIRILVNLFNSFLVYEKETLILKKGFVKNTIIGKNSEIEGNVYDSIIFKNVKIRENCEVINSIVLPNNIIGKNCKIKNTLIGTNNSSERVLSIGNNCELGIQLGKILKNIKYSKDLPDGFTLVGNNIVVPSGFKVGKNCVIRGEIEYIDLKKMNVLIDGGTIEK